MKTTVTVVAEDVAVAVVVTDAEDADPEVVVVEVEAVVKQMVSSGVVSFADNDAVTYSL